ncbi:MAG: mechanosensitive ion channel protein [Gammaproteobacteria bacterium]|nr:mechanosensitive ion channel [Gammaproteobacteria bacterium]GIT37716.1 MAG: mechanosensitive ion channel protein [Gammaproteobacteria bacterium]|tara:strand:+ start:272 stop:1099 length:828 start_codon:yes stop_codon:yes gene_type:complete
MGTELTKDMLNSLIEIGSSLSISLLMALAILIIGRQLVKLILRLITVALEKSNVEDTVRIFVTNLLNTLLMILVFIAAINQLGIETTSIIAVLGAAGLAIGLALQGSLSNFAAGILIVIYRPYKVGDYIEAGNYAGTVKDIQIFSTVLKTPDNKIVVVPNGSIMNGSIVNYSDQDTRRIDLIVSCGYEDDIDKVRSVLEDILKKEKRVLKDPKPQIAVTELADSSVNFIFRPWVKRTDYLPVYYSLLEEVKKRFDKEGISIPYPQSDVHIHNHKE